jgi:hypothetical protein
MVKKIFLFGLVVSICCLGVLMHITTPSDTGPLGILLVFVFLYTAFLSALTFLIYWGSRLWRYSQKRFKSRRIAKIISFRKAYYYSTVLAFAPVIVVALHSVGAVGLYELTLITTLMGLGVFYITKRM